MGSDSPSDRVEDWGMVEDGEIDVGMVGGTIVYGAITTAVSSAMYFGIETVSEIGAVYSLLVSEGLWLIERIFDVPIEVLESGSSESVAFIGSWGLFAYPIAIVVIIASLGAIQWAVRNYA